MIVSPHDGGGSLHLKIIIGGTNMAPDLTGMTELALHISSAPA